MGKRVYATSSRVPMLRRFMLLLKFPKDLAKYTESEFGIFCGWIEAVDEATDFLLWGSRRATLLEAAGIGSQIARGAEGVEQEHSKALEIGGRGRSMFLLFRRGLRIAG